MSMARLILLHLGARLQAGSFLLPARFFLEIALVSLVTVSPDTL